MHSKQCLLDTENNRSVIEPESFVSNVRIRGHWDVICASIVFDHPNRSWQLAERSTSGTSGAYQYPPWVRECWQRDSCDFGLDPDI